MSTLDRLAGAVVSGCGRQGMSRCLRSWCARRAAIRLFLVVASLSALGAAVVPASALALPDGRAYELVTPQDKNGIQPGTGLGALNGSPAPIAGGAVDGDSVDWTSIGGCCGATSSALTLYKSTRTSTGWQTTSISPNPPTPLVGLFAEQAPVWVSLDLNDTIFTTPASYAAGDQRPPGPGVNNYLDLYEQGPTGSMTWLSQGPFPGAGTNPFTATFDGASPDGDHVAFDTQEQLTADATGLANLNTPPQFLYERNAAEGTTNLVNIYATSLTAPAEGRVSTSLAANSVGVTPTTLTAAVGPAVNTTLANSATAGDTSITVASATGLITGETIDIDPGGAHPEQGVIAGISGSAIALQSALGFDHASGASVTYPGDNSIAVADAANFSAGQTITIDPGTGNAETDTIASVTGNTMALTATVSNPHAAGATVQHAAPDTTLTVASSSGFKPGQTITIDTGGPQEIATIGSVPDGTHITLTGPLQNNHQSGAPVVYGGDLSITVANAGPFSAGQVMTLDAGASAETVTIAAVPNTTTIDLASGLRNNHAAGAPLEGLVSPDGAILGNGNWLAQGFMPADVYGTTTNAVSSDGSKLYFESPPSFPGGSGSAEAEGVGPPNLYLRDESNSTTTLIADDAQYEGAAQDGTLAFYTSGGRLYEFNSTGAMIGQVPPMSSFSISDGQNGAPTAISNDGSHVYFVSTAALPSSDNAQGQGPIADRPNLYVFDTAAATKATAFVATLSQVDQPVLTAEPDLARPAIPTPDGTVLVFESNANLTGQNSAAASTLAADASPGDTSITVTSTTGFKAGQGIIIGSGASSDGEGVTGVSGSTIDLSGPLSFSHSTGERVDQLAPFEIYRYATADGSLTCVSCVPTGVLATGNADLGAAGGGSYEPSDNAVPMSSNGSIIFFDSPDPLAPGVNNTGLFPNGPLGPVLTKNVFEWQNGQVSLISDGSSTLGAELDGTTPSGNDVFFNTAAQLVPQETDGYIDIYDARVNGGFPAGSGASPTCDSAQSCRTTISPSEFFPVPSTSTLIEPNVGAPTFSVRSISPKRRKQFANTGKLKLTVLASSAGRITATASATIDGVHETLSTATAWLFATHGGTATLTLTLNRTARKALAKKHTLVVDIAVSYSESNQVEVAAVTLTKGKTGKKTKRHAAALHPKREQAGRRLSPAAPVHASRSRER